MLITGIYVKDEKRSDIERFSSFILKDKQWPSV